MLKKIFLLTTLVFILFTNRLVSQVVWEDPNSEVYHFLYRMAQKGLIRYDDNIRPLSRVYLAACLDSLESRSNQLSEIEIKELRFYQRDFTDQRSFLQNTSTEKKSLFSKDPYHRWRSISVSSGSFILRVDPVLSAATISGSGKQVTRYSSGFNLYGYANKHWGFFLSYNDVNEKGNGIDTLRNFTSEPGIVTKIASNGKSHNFSELRGGISYSWNNGSISLGQDRLTWGYGENGHIVLSAKAPAYPYIRLDYQPLPWLSFHYTHAWLQSGILDSARTYRTGYTAYGGVRELFVRKFMAQHSLRIGLTKGVDLAIGESVVYSDELNIGYLIPVSFFKIYDNLINSNRINNGSNGQIFAQISSRNNLRNTHLYGTLFIDEIRLGSVFDRAKSRNQLGYTVGASVTDLGIPYLTAGLEYTRINPFVYRNLIPAQDYTSHQYSLGDWMGNNSDRFIASLKYTPLPRLKMALRYQYLRKGGPGTIDQQYFQQPQPAFLFDLQVKQQEWLFQCSYEWYNNLYLTGYYTYTHNRYPAAPATITDRSLYLGIRYGL